VEGDVDPFLAVLDPYAEWHWPLATSDSGVYRVRARISGLSVEEVVAHLWQFDDGRVVRMRMFGNADKAKARFTGRDPSSGGYSPGDVAGERGPDACVL
jgi:ketosteroid isomerase-like protein